MKYIRKGNDITLKWFLTINNGKTALADADLTIELSDQFGRITTLPYTVYTQYIELKYYGIQHGPLGVYTLTAYINKDSLGQAVVDMCDAFKLVARSCEEQGQDNGNLNTETVTLVSALSVGIQGASAYDIWLTQGHTGTQADFIEWLQHNDVTDDLQDQIDEINGVGDTTDDIDTLPEVIAAMEGMKAGDTVKETIEGSNDPLDEAEMNSLKALFPTS